MLRTRESNRHSKYSQVLSMTFFQASFSLEIKFCHIPVSKLSAYFIPCLGDCSH